MITVWNAIGIIIHNNDIKFDSAVLYDHNEKYTFIIIIHEVIAIV